MSDTEQDKDLAVVNPKYKGKTQHYKPDFIHPNQKSKQAVKPKQTGPMSKTLPPPSNKAAMQNPTPYKNDPIFKDEIFSSEIIVRELNSRTPFEVNLAAATEISDDMYREIKTDTTQIDKQMLPEALRYYTTGLTWIRIAHLKDGTQQPTSDEEQRLLSMTKDINWSVPEPLYVYLKSIGALKTDSTLQSLIPRFPPMPTEAINNRNGFYGLIDVNNHNNYEEIPTLGVAAEALQHALSDLPPGRHPSVLDTQHVLVNSNLLGFENLTNRRNEAKRVFNDIGIDEQHFPESIHLTAFNMDLMLLISQWLATTNTFKIQNVNFKSLGLNGGQHMTIIQRPYLIDPDIGQKQSIQMIRQTSLSKSSNTNFGLGYYCIFQLYKEPLIVPDHNPSQNNSAWCCQTYTGANANTTIPPEYIVNRNNRRSLPIEYHSSRFEAMNLNVRDVRRKTITHMIVSRR